jgi:5-methylcytosine-specific restriction endonuclease McrA
LGSATRWKELEDLWIKQDGICPYTGSKLILGVDASLDHILPSSRFPEHRHDINNVEWVHYRVNEMKKDWTKEEFLQFMRGILANV